jgi:hypothetical protein
MLNSKLHLVFILDGTGACHNRQTPVTNNNTITEVNTCSAHLPFPRHKFVVVRDPVNICNPIHVPQITDIKLLFPYPDQISMSLCLYFRCFILKAFDLRYNVFLVDAGYVRFKLDDHIFSSFLSR